MADKELNRAFFREAGRRGAKVRWDKATDKDRQTVRKNLMRAREKRTSITGFSMFNKLEQLAKTGRRVVVRLNDGMRLQGKIRALHPAKQFIVQGRQFRAREVGAAVEVKK